MKLRFQLGILASLIFLGGCAATSPNTDERVGQTLTRAGKPSVTYVAREDKSMTSAIQKSRDNVNIFIAALRSPKAGQDAFSIKKRFGIEQDGEHIWLSDVTYDGKLFHGRVANDPVDVKNVELGDAVTVAPREISDWMFTTNKKLSGGYTIRVLYDKMSPAEKKQLEQESGLIF